jgi:Icc-related predicted phosphoesterase
MHILAVADKLETALTGEAALIHYPKVDIIFSCGDLAPEYLSQIQRKFEVPLFYVRGNHDVRYQAKPPVGCTNINGRIISYNDLRILGLEGSRWYNGGPAQYTEREMRTKLWKLWTEIWRHRGVDIVVAHAPPRHIHDAEDLCHRGFKTFRRLIDRHRPAYFLHGHIHADFNESMERITLIDRTRVINCYGHFYFEAKGNDVTC